MTKSELIDTLAARRQIPRQVAEEVVNLFFEEIKQSMQKGDRIEFRGFGSFHMRQYEGYTGRNPRTLKEIEVPPKQLPLFKPSPRLIARLNEPLEG